MANPIKKDELVTDEALGQLKLMADRLTIIAENLTKAKEACQSWGEEEKKNSATTSNNVEELSKMAARITQLEDAIKKLNAAEKENENARRSVNEQKRLYRKLTDDEIKSVEDLKRALQGSVDEQMKAVNAIEVEKKSYNELNQVYNALKDTLNKMTTAERENTDAGKAMTAQASKVYETMNQLQQATGKYTLQVGKYSAAFDGLGYSFQQILREAPSALNLNQFFLAISNNIPQFLDQLKAFNAEQKAIKDNLATMTKGTAEYAEQLGKVESVGKKLGKVLISWQSLVMVGLMILRNMDRIIAGINSLFSNLTKEQKMLKAVNEEASSSIGDMTAKYVALQKEWQNLKAEDMPGWLEQHKNDWSELGRVIDNAKEAEDFYVNNTAAVQEAIDKRARSIAAMKIAAEKYEEAFNKEVEAENAVANRSASTWNRVKQILMGFSGAKYSWTRNYLKKTIEEDAKAYAEDMREEAKALREEATKLITKFVLPEEESNTKKGPKRKESKDPKEQDLADRYWEAERALLNAMEEGMQKEIEISDWERRKNKDEQDKWYAEQLAALKENVHNKFMTQQQADAEAAELKRQYDALQEDEDRQHNERVVKIQMDAYRKQLAIREELHKKEMQAIVAASKADTVHVQRRVRNATQEENKNTALANNIKHLVEAKKKLMAVDIAMDESKTLEERIKLLEQLNKLIERYASQISITQKIRQHGSVSDMLGTFIVGRVGGQGKENLISNILGEDAMKARIAGFQADNPDGWEKDYMDWLDGEFEEWGKQAMSAATTWYSTTMGYINDLISAYVELANAKAEAAAEATEAAQEEYDKEKALLEAGYASRVEATWAEYQEKKAAQEKAEEDAKAAAKAQQQLNEAEAMGSLIVASANIWKTFSKIPTVGVPLALAALATMWGSFIQAKVKAAEVSKYGEGGFEVLEGGSHASGHDIDLGVKNRRGRRMRAEGQEGLGIFSRRAMEHYGANNIEAMVNSVNRLEFEGNAAKRMSLERSVGMAVLSAPRTDLHNVESDLHKLVAYGARSIHHNPDGTVVETRKNARITYHVMR